MQSIQWVGLGVVISMILTWIVGALVWLGVFDKSPETPTGIYVLPSDSDIQPL
jgi:hypothetical protein